MWSTDVDVVPLLDVDRDLLAAIPADQAHLARRMVTAEVVWLDPGPWTPPEPPATPSYFGLLLLDGLIGRDVQLAGMGCMELLGPGDLLRPADQQAALPSVPFEVAFHVERRARLAVLEKPFNKAAATWPALTAELLARSVRRSQSLAMHLAITCLTGTDLRLHVLFWHLADRYGHVEPDGVVVPLELTHEMLGRLVRGRRPAVSVGLKRLRERGLVTRREDGSWLLKGGPPDGGTVVAASPPFMDTGAADCGH